MAKLVVVRSFLNHSDAYFAKALLDDAQIPAQLHDEYSSSYAFIAEGIKVVVPQSFEQQALNILDEKFNESNTEIFDDLDSNKAECPKCGSTRLYLKNNTYSSFAILFLLLGIFSGGTNKKKKLKCRDCQYSWRDY